MIELLMSLLYYFGIILGMFEKVVTFWAGFCFFLNDFFHSLFCYDDSLPLNKVKNRQGSEFC